MKDCEDVILGLGTKLKIHRPFNLDSKNMTVRISHKEGGENSDQNSKAWVCPIETL